MALDDLAQLVDRDHEQVVLPRDCGRRPGNNPDVVDKVSGVMPGGGDGAKDAVLQAFAIPKTREEPQVCRLVWEFFCQVVFWFVPVPCLERKGRSSSRRLRSGSRSARKVSRDRNASAA